MFDPSKASNEEWSTGGTFDPNGPNPMKWIWGPKAKPTDQSGKVIAVNVPVDDAEEIVLLHNERLIMERRKPMRWFVFPWNDGWVVCYGNGHKLTRDDGTYFTGPHPIGLLSEADAYFRERGK